MALVRRRALGALAVLGRWFDGSAHPPASPPCMARRSERRPWSTARELADAIRARPGQLRIGTSGAGTISQLFTRQLAQMLGLERGMHIATFDLGGGAAMAAVAAGEVDAAFDLLPGVIPLLKARQVRALAVGSRYRAVWVRELEAVPAISEIRPDLDVDATDWFGAVMRGGTPAEVIAAMNGAVGRVLEREDVRAALMAEGVLPHPDPSAADVQAFWTQELPVRRRLVEGVAAQLDGSRRPGIDPLARTG